MIAKLNLAGLSRRGTFTRAEGAALAAAWIWIAVVLIHMVRS
jgi:hypothetical protein